MADVVIMSNRLSNVARAVDIGRRTRHVLRQNLTIALGVMLVMVIATLFGQVSLTMAVVAAEGSALIVCLSALRLLWSPREPADEA